MTALSIIKYYLPAMNTKKAKRLKKATTPKMIRFPNDIVVWLQKQAATRGISSEAELVRQIVHTERQRIEQESAA